MAAIPSALEAFWSQNAWWIVEVVLFVLGMYRAKIRRGIRLLLRSKSKQPEIPIPKVYPIKSLRTRKTIISYRYARSFSLSAAIGTGLLGASVMTGVVTFLAVLLSTGPVTFPLGWFYAAAICMEVLGFILIGARGGKMLSTEEGRLALGNMLAWAGRKPTVSGKESRKLTRSYLAIGEEDRVSGEAEAKDEQP